MADRKISTEAEQVILNLWADWQARCPEWREGNGEPEEYDEDAEYDEEDEDE